MIRQKKTMKVFVGILLVSFVAMSASLGSLIKPLLAQQGSPPKLTWCGASLWNLTEEQFNMVFLTKPYYAAAIFVSNFVYGGRFLTTQAERFFSLADTHSIDVILAIDMIDYKNDPNDDRTKAIIGAGYSTWQDALKAVCAHFQANHPSLKYIGIYHEFSTPTKTDFNEFVGIVRSYGFEGFDWTDIKAALDPSLPVLWRPRTGYPWQNEHGIKEVSDGISYFKGTDALTGEEWAVTRYPPLGIKVEDRVWGLMNEFYAPSLSFAVSFDYWSPSMWYSEEEVDRIFRLSRKYIDEHPDIPFKYVGIGSGNLKTKIEEVWTHGGYCYKYSLIEEGFRLRDIFGLKIGPQFHPDIIDYIYNKAVEYGFQTRLSSPSPPLQSYALSINSSPISGVSFSVDGLSYVTPFSATVSEGNYTVVMPKSAVIGATAYSFKDWENGSTNSTRIVNVVGNLSLTANYEEVTAPPATHFLSVSTSPVSGISFTVNGTGYVTPWSEALADGIYEVLMPSNVTIDEVAYQFVKWEDNSTDGLRVVNLSANMPLTAYYEAESPPQTDSVSVAVQVKDAETNLPIDGALVYIENGNWVSETVQTDSDGWANYTEVEIGDYSIVGNAQEYSTALEEVSISTDTTCLLFLERNAFASAPVAVPELAPILVITSVSLVGYLVIRRKFQKRTAE